MKTNYKAFTLIELLIVITIIALLMMVVFVPYSHSQKKAKLRLAWREIAQVFYDAKNMAVSWIKEQIDEETDLNSAVGLYMSTYDSENTKVSFYTFPFDIEKEYINISNEYLYKEYMLQEWIRINYLSWFKSLLFFFDSIEWNVEILSFENNNLTWYVDNIKIEIMLSYLNSDSASLQKWLTYFRNTNLIDYENL